MPKKKKNYGKHETIDEKVKRRKREEKERQKRLERIEKKNRKNAKHSLSNTQYEDDIDTVIKMSNRHNQPNTASMQTKQNYLDNSDLQDSYKLGKSNGSKNSRNPYNSRNSKISNNSRSSYDSRNSKKGKNRNQKSGSGKKVVTFIIILLFVVGICAFALTSPIFNIKDIQVINNNKISSDTILSLSSLKKGENIFKFYNKNIEDHIKEEPYIASATIHRKLPDIVQIDVTERTVQFAIEYMEKYVYIDNQGYILELNSDKQSFPIIKGISLDQENITPGNRLNNDNLDKLEAVIEIIASMKESKLDEKITSIDVTNKNNYSVYLESEKKTVHIGDTSNLSNKMLYVQAIIEQEKDNEGDIFVNGDLNEGFDPYFRSKV